MIFSFKLFNKQDKNVGSYVLIDQSFKMAVNNENIDLELFGLISCHKGSTRETAKYICFMKKKDEEG